MKVADRKGVSKKPQISGFIDVKIPSKGRIIGPWKAWKRQWCTVQRSSTTNKLELILGSNCNDMHNTIEIPNCAILCRSESRSRCYAFGIFLSDNKHQQGLIYLAGKSETESQNWMSFIRMSLKQSVLPVLGEEFPVSLIDNLFSKTSGLYGVYGILSLNETEMIIRDPRNGEISASWKWSQIENTFIPDSPSSSEDIGKILGIQLSSFDDKGGGGGILYLFCSEAEQLQSSLCQYRLKRQYRLVTSPLPPTPPKDLVYQRLNSSRRLSRSEGDLRWPFQSSLLLSHILSRSSSRERNSKSLSNTGNDDKDVNLLRKGARRLVLASANFGLLLSTPGCSEPDSLHEYQSLDYDDLSDISESCHDRSRYQSETDVHSECDHLDDLPNQDYFRMASAPGELNSTRRVSGVSVASGIYAEIDESVQGTASPLCYENLRCFPSSTTSHSISPPPPPLPPRKSIRDERSGEVSYVNKAISNNKDLEYSTENGSEMYGYVPLTQCDESEMGACEITSEHKNNDLHNSQTIELPPPLPPRKATAYASFKKGVVIKNEKGCVADSKHLNLESKDQYTVQGAGNVSEPDYLPMSQVSGKMSPIKEDTYVVMANLINNKLAVSGL